MTFPIGVSTGFVISIAFDYGQLQCSSLGIASSMAVSTMTVNSCTSTRASIQTSGIVGASSTVWLALNYITYTSIIVNNIVIDITSVTGYAIMSGLSTIALTASQPPFTVSSSNTTFTGISNYTFA